MRKRTQAILSYARAYTSRNCLLRLLTAGGDAEQYQGLVEELGRLGDDLMLLLATDSNARLQAVQAGMEEAVALLKQAAAYKVSTAAAWAEQVRMRCCSPEFIGCRCISFRFICFPCPSCPSRLAHPYLTRTCLCWCLHVQDPAADARALVEEYGGIDAVMADRDKMGAVMQTMDISARMTIEVVSSVCVCDIRDTLAGQMQGRSNIRGGERACGRAPRGCGADQQGRAGLFQYITPQLSRLNADVNCSKVFWLLRRW